MTINLHIKCLSSLMDKDCLNIMIARHVLCVLGLISYVTADCYDENLLSNCTYKCGESVPHKTYWRQDSINNYLRVTDLPAMSELTACFYYDPAGLPSTTDPWLISIANRGDFNAFILGSMGRQGLSMHLESAANTITNDLEAFDSPHKHCFVWSDGHYMKWFFDRNTPGVLELAAHVGDSGRQVIAAGSVMTILNEQDTLGGGLVANQMVPGHLADFQMWNRAFSDAEVEGLRCGAVGNIVTFEDLETVGKANFRYGGNFECACVTEMSKVVT